MLWEERADTLHPGTTSAFLEEYRAHGIRIHQRHLGEQVGFFTTDVGVQWSSPAVAPANANKRCSIRSGTKQAYEIMLLRELNTRVSQ